MDRNLLPAVNINGTSREELIEQRVSAHRALLKAVEELRKTAPHGRDYIGRSANLGEARQQWANRVVMLENLAKELEEEVLEIFS